MVECMAPASTSGWKEGGGRRLVAARAEEEKRSRRKILPRGHCTRPKIHLLKKKSFLRTFWSNQILFQVIGNLCIKATGGSLLPKKHYHLEQAGNKHWVSVATRFQSCFLGLFFFFSATTQDRQYCYKWLVGSRGGGCQPLGLRRPEAKPAFMPLAFS